MAFAVLKSASAARLLVGDCVLHGAAEPLAGRVGEEPEDLRAPSSVQRRRPPIPATWRT